MKARFAAVMLVGITAFTVSSTGIAQEKIEGVKGGLTLIEKNAETAGKADEIQVRVGEQIEITWTYPIVPGSIPKKVGGKSSSEAVKFEEVLSISQPKVLGVGRLGAFFKAEKIGKATLEFDINNGAGKGVILKVEVQVAAAS